MSRETGRWFGKQCYFGAHNDFHYMDNDMNAASQATPENFLNYLKILRPDWMQVDSKGHSGNSSYFSRVPAASIAPHLKHDAVAAWRQATREFGIPLVCHYSGFIDLAAARRHPEWMAVLPPGMKRAEPLVWYEATMCPRSNYFDQLMIPQLIELAADWHVDGFWIDGDWGYRGCYCPKCVAAFQADAGVEMVPVNPGDPGFDEWRKFQAESWCQVIRKYTEAVHAVCPNVLICSAWAQSFHSPGTNGCGTDWLSGDLPFIWSSDWARVEPRYMSAQGKPWNMMLWSTVVENNRRNLKSLDHLAQEASASIACGGGIDFCENAYLRTSQMVPWRLRRLAKFGDFVRRRQNFCQDNLPYGEVAVLVSENGEYLKSMRRNMQSIRNAVLALLDCHYSVEAGDEYAILPRLHEFRLVVIPGDPPLASETVEALKKYVEQGGALLLSGCGLITRFGEEYCGVADMQIETHSPYAGEIQSYNSFREITPMYYAASGDALFPFFSEKWGICKTTAAGKALGKLFYNNAPEESSVDHPAGIVSRHGAGAVAAVPADLFFCYHEMRIREYREFIQAIVRAIYPVREIEVEAPSVVDVMFRRKNGELQVPLLNNSTGTLRNTTPPLLNSPADACYQHSAYIDEIPELGGIVLDIHCERAPRHVISRPENKRIDFSFSDGKLHMEGLKVRIHNAVCIAF